MEETDILPCGCIIKALVIDGVNTVQYYPCSETCSNYADAIELARKGNKPIHRRNA